MRTTAPSRRRQGLTPRTISSTAHTVSVTPTSTVSVRPALPAGCSSVRTTMAASAIVSARFGRCMIVIRPVSRLRNIHWKIERAHATESALVAARALVRARGGGAPLPIAVFVVGVGVSFLGVIVIAVLRWGPAREV